MYFMCLKKKMHQLPPHRYRRTPIYLERSQPGWDIQASNRIKGEKVKTFHKYVLVGGSRGTCSQVHTNGSLRSRTGDPAREVRRVKVAQSCPTL